MQLLPYNANRSRWKFRGCMILLFTGKLLRLHSNSKHLIIKKKKFAGKPSRLEANPRKPQNFSTASDLHYTDIYTGTKILISVPQLELMAILRLR